MGICRKFRFFEGPIKKIVEVPMMRMSIVFITAAIIFAIPQQILSQAGRADLPKDQAAEEKKAEDRKIDEAIRDLYKRLKIGVQLFIDWQGLWGHESNTFDRVALFERGQDASPKNNNAFRIQRAFLDVRYQISDIFSVRLTSDADVSVTPAAASNAAFHLFLKYAFIEAKKDFGPVWFSLAGGMIETPVLGYINKISDYRWIAQNYLQQSRSVINNQIIDFDADLGIRGSLGIMKYVTLTGAFTNGGGFKADESNSYKAVTYMMSITPVKELHFFGYGRNEITAKYDYTGKKARREYYGYGVAYSSELVKIGAVHAFPYVQTVGVASKFDPSFIYGTNEIYIYPVQRRGYMIIDSWLHLNLGAVAPAAPLILTGRFVYGIQRRTYQKYITDTECGKQRQSFLYAAGIGWRLSKNFRILFGAELQRYIVKKDRLLRYTESAASGTDYYNGSGLGLGNVYVGSRNPHDAKRLYIKTEVIF